MGNVLTGLIPTLYEALNVVAREQVGLTLAVRTDSNAERAALNQTVRVPLGVAGAMEDITPGQLPANSGGTTVGYTDITITKAKAVPILWSGEEQRAVGSTGVYNKVLSDQFAEGMRTLVNAIEVDLAAELLVNSSRAVGTAGATPFGTAGDLSGFALPLQVLEDNGAPKSDLQFVANTTALANLRGKQSVLFKVNEAGSSDMLRNGMTDRVQGFALRASAGLAPHTKGTGTAYVTSGSQAAGTSSAALITGSGTVLAGDVITLAGDTNNYVVNTGVAAAGTITINAPGFRQVENSGIALTIGNSYTPCFAFARQAMVLAARAPALPTGGDSAEDRMTITDPLSGLKFEVSVYRQYRQIKFEIAICWGVRCIKPQFVATLMG